MFARNDRLNQLAMQLSTRYKRRFRKDVCLIDPVLRSLHERIERIDPSAILTRNLGDSRFIVIDTETTGLHAYAGDEILSIALIELDGLQLTGTEYNTYVNPGCSIPAESTKIHGITDADVAGSPTLMEVLPEVIAFIDQAVIVGHHVNFDLRFLNKVFQKKLLTRLYNPYLDTMLLYLGCSGKLGHHTLDDLAEQCQVTVQDRHSARGDAMITALIFQCLVVKLMDDVGTVLDLAGHQYHFGRFQSP